jgi:UDP-glucuronate decarboxylase
MKESVALTLFFDQRRFYGTSIKMARIFNTYGPRMLENDGRVASNFIVQALREVPITCYGDGRQTRSFCYIDDLLTALELLIESGPDVTGPCNLGNPHEVPVRDIAHMVLGHTGSRSRIEHRPLPQDDPKRRQPVIAFAQPGARVAACCPRTRFARDD